MVLDEVLYSQNKIRLYEHVLDCLNVKLYYLQNKRVKSEFADAEQRIEIAKISHLIELQKGKLHHLYGEYNLQFDLLKSEFGEKSALENLMNDVKLIDAPAEVAICIVANSSFYETVYAIENLVANTKVPFKLYIYNLNPRLKTYFELLISHVCDCEIIDYTSDNENVTLGMIYNNFLEAASEKYGVIFPTNAVVNKNWLMELKYAYENYENSGCISIKQNVADLKLSALLFTGEEDEMKTVYVNRNNYFTDFVFFQFHKCVANGIGHFHISGLHGLEIAEWSFRWFASGMNNYFIKYQNAIRLKVTDNFLYPEIDKKTVSNFKQIANESLTVQKNEE